MSMSKLDELKANTSSIQRFSVDMRFYDVWLAKSGTVVAVRNDLYERAERAKEPTRWYYHVDYVDGSFETMSAQSDMSYYHR